MVISELPRDAVPPPTYVTFPISTAVHISYLYLHVCVRTCVHVCMIGRPPVAPAGLMMSWLERHCTSKGLHCLRWGLCTSMKTQSL